MPCGVYRSRAARGLPPRGQRPRRRLAPILRRLWALAPDVALVVTVGFSHDLRPAYDRGDFDAVIVRRDAERRDGVALYREPLVWAAAPDCSWRAGDPVPLLALASPCGVRAAAMRALEGAGIGWTDALSCSSVPTVQAAVAAGLGVAPLGVRHVSEGVNVVEHLPGLPDLDVVLYGQPADPRLSQALRRLSALFTDDRARPAS